MSPRAFISTECSQCGGALNLEQGTNTLTCPYCGSSFLITGYDRVLSYYIPLDTEERRTVVKVLSLRYLLTTAESYRIQTINLVYLPFYHLRGNIFRSLANAGNGLFATPVQREDQEKLQARHLDRSFPATGLKGVKLYSLGVRTSVLQLKLYKEGALRERGSVYPVTVDIKRALETGLGTMHGESTGSCVTAMTLSIVYAPLWEVNVEGCGQRFSLIVDALAESIIEHRAPFHHLTENLGELPDGPFPTIRFNAFTCPNCGWDIEPDPALSVFVCGNCHRVWECTDTGLREARGAIAQVQPVDEGTEHVYFPFWLLPATTERTLPGIRSRKAMKLYIPAFKARDLNLICRLAITYSRVQPDLDLKPLPGDIPATRIKGASMKWNDARKLADLLVGTGTEKMNIPSEEAASRQLVWLPFYEKGMYLRDTLLNLGIQKGKLQPPARHHFLRSVH